jgi:hypothetical protein
MPDKIENRMVVDGEWGEIEYGVPKGSRLTRERRAYEQAEREEMDNE